MGVGLPIWYFPSWKNKTLFYEYCYISCISMVHINGLAQDCGNSSALTLELSQSYANNVKPSTSSFLSVYVLSQMVHILVLSLFAVMVLHPELVQESQVFPEVEGPVFDNNYSYGSYQWLREKHWTSGESHTHARKKLWLGEFGWRKITLKNTSESHKIISQDLNKKVF